MNEERTMDIKILGTGCPRCEELQGRTLEALAELNIAAAVEKVTDIKRIAALGVLATPALVIDGQVKCSGRLPRPEEIRLWLVEAYTRQGS
jgi:small redox-active disulfide protein 2